MKKFFALSLLALATGAQAHLTFFQGTFAPEAPNATGMGTLFMEYDEDAHTLFIDAEWSGLSGNTSTAHIHCCTSSPNTGTAGVALAQGGVLPGFPLGAKSGSYERLIDLTQANQYSASFISASGGTTALAEARLIGNLTSGNAYFNIHSTTFGGGEIRAFVTVVPEPGTYALMLGGLGLLSAAVRRRAAAQR
ncbi:MAG: CHRD domain-containing protein [Rubrivivax sp.]|nr:CHRD domain-containing protein [Rubrivivax sp.]